MQNGQIGTNPAFGRRRCKRALPQTQTYKTGHKSSSPQNRLPHFCLDAASSSGEMLTVHSLFTYRGTVGETLATFPDPSSFGEQI
jgi:hypothetical protein